jgi:hypothetical protein
VQVELIHTARRITLVKVVVDREINQLLYTPVSTFEVHYTSMTLSV